MLTNNQILPATYLFIFTYVKLCDVKASQAEPGLIAPKGPGYLSEYSGCNNGISYKICLSTRRKNNTF